MIYKEWLYLGIFLQFWYKRHPILSRPDLVLVSNNFMYLFELTIPTNTQQHLLAARAQKEDKYSALLYGLQCAGLTVQLISIEVGCLDHFIPETLPQAATACRVPK